MPLMSVNNLEHILYQSDKIPALTDMRQALSIKYFSEMEFKAMACRKLCMLFRYIAHINKILWDIEL